jgi:hypothetical protein
LSTLSVFRFICVHLLFVCLRPISCGSKCCQCLWIFHSCFSRLVFSLWLSAIWFICSQIHLNCFTFNYFEVDHPKMKVIPETSPPHMIVYLSFLSSSYFLWVQMLPVSLNFSFLIFSSGFSNVHLPTWVLRITMHYRSKINI